MLASVQLVVFAGAPPNVTVPPAVPNPAPMMVIVLPTGAVVAEMELISAPTEKFTALLDLPDTLTITGPLLAVVGIVTTMLVSLQLVGFTPFPATATPFSVAVLKPRVVPNPDPWMVRLEPTGPVLDATPFTRKPVMLGLVWAMAIPQKRTNTPKVAQTLFAISPNHLVVSAFCQHSSLIGPSPAPRTRHGWLGRTGGLHDEAKVDIQGLLNWVGR
jgi:hypothetical protein